jgi:hypothetical protein
VKESTIIHPKSHFGNPKVRVENIWESKVLPNFDIYGQATVSNVYNISRLTRFIFLSSELLKNISSNLL